LYVLFSWIKIAVINLGHSKEEEKLNRIRNVTFGVISVWLGIWIILEFIGGVYLNLPWMSYLAIGCLALLPLGMTFGFIIFANIMRSLLSSMSNTAKGKRFARKISYLTLIYVGSLDCHIIWAGLFFAGYSPEGTIWTSLPFYYFPQVVVCLTTLWFINPYNLRSRKSRSASHSSKPENFSSTSVEDIETPHTTTNP